MRLYRPLDVRRLLNQSCKTITGVENAGRTLPPPASDPLLRVRKSGVLSRHRHPQPVHGFVLKGRWHYLEHDWEAREGGYVYEPPGETHTLVVPDDVEEMITYFQVNGVMLYVDPWGKTMGYEDVFTKIEMCRTHYEAVGLGADYVEQFIR